MATISIEYYGVEGSGRTVTEAKKDAGRKIEQSLAGSYKPEIVTHRGFAVMVWREPSGYSVAIIVDPDGGGVRERLCECHYQSKEDAMRSARHMVAQNTWTAEDGTSAPEFMTDRNEIAEFRSWAEFQLRYIKARAAGLGSNDAHDWANRNPMRPDLVALQIA